MKSLALMSPHSTGLGSRLLQQLLFLLLLLFALPHFALLLCYLFFFLSLLVLSSLDPNRKAPLMQKIIKKKKIAAKVTWMKFTCGGDGFHDGWLTSFLLFFIIFFFSGQENFFSVKQYTLKSIGLISQIWASMAMCARMGVAKGDLETAEFSRQKMN